MIGVSTIDQVIKISYTFIVVSCLACGSEVTRVDPETT